MKKKVFNKTTTPIITVVGILIGGLLLLKVIADSQSRVPY